MMDNGSDAVEEESPIFPGLDRSIAQILPITHIYKSSPAMKITRKHLDNTWSVFEIIEVKVLQGNTLFPTQDRSKNEAYQALKGTQWTFSKDTAMFCVVPQGDLWLISQPKFIQLNNTSKVSDHGTVLATVAYQNQNSSNFHFKQESTPLDGYEQWATAHKASPFHGKSPLFGSTKDKTTTDKKLSKINTFLSPAFAKGSVWAKDFTLKSQLSELT